jgi:hypothetical protein
MVHGKGDKECGGGGLVIGMWFALVCGYPAQSAPLLSRLVFTNSRLGLDPA